MSSCSPIVTQGYGPGCGTTFMTMGYDSSPEAVAAALAKYGVSSAVQASLDIVRGGSGGGWMGPRPKVPMPDNFTIRIGLASVNKKRKREEDYRTVSYVTHDEGTSIKISLKTLQITDEPLFIQARIRAQEGISL